MALINRITKLFRADLHAVLDNIEEPEQLLKQAIREMQQDLYATEDTIAHLQKSQRKIESRHSQLKQSMDKYPAELDLCFQSEEEDLARSLIKRQLETTQLRDHLASQNESIQQQIAELQSRRSEKQMQLESMQQKAELLIAEATVLQGDPLSPWDNPATSINTDEIEIAFLNEKQRRQ
ncbi:MAG: PspA/IM30 family protein [Xanthomonadales bacterium]|nr:PspA/IM30 family protein [Xanthomonadales bacterium]